MKKNLRYQIGGWTMAFILAFAACTDEDTPAVPKGKAGTLHIESVTVDDVKVGSRAVAEGGTTYDSGSFPYNQAVTGFSTGDVMTLNLENGSVATAYAKYNGTTWDIYSDIPCTVAAEIKPGNGKKWDELSISIAPFTLTSDTDLSGDELTNNVLTTYDVSLFDGDNKAGCFLYGDKLEVEELNIDKELTSATLGAVSIELKHANALLRLPVSAVNITPGTYIQGGTAYGVTGLATLWAEYTNESDTHYSPLTKVTIGSTEYWQAIVPAGSSIKLTGFKAVLKKNSSTTFTLDLPFQTQASGGSATAMPTDGYELQPGYQYSLSLLITPSKQAVSLTAPSGKPGWNTDGEVALVSPESELEWVAANGTVAAHFKVSGPNGLKLLNHWMTGQTGADISGIKGYVTSDLNVYDEGRLSKNITLAANITLPTPENGKSNWIPIDAYTGTFDGADYSISGLVINNNNDSNAGFFASIGSVGIVQNAYFIGANVANAETAGVIAGANGGVIRQCVVTGSVVSGSTAVGGIAGQSTGAIVACAYQGQVTLTNSGNSGQLGGIAGSGNAYGSWATGYAVTGDGCYTTLNSAPNSASNLNDEGVIMQMNRAVIAYNSTAAEANKATKGWKADTDADTDTYPDYVDLSTLPLGNYELEWVTTNQGTTSKYFRVTGPHGLQLLNKWMTGQAEADITGIVGYNANDLNINDTYTRQGKHITIDADITLPEVADGESNWIPLSGYHGSISGGNHTISGLRIHNNVNTVYVGFVGVLQDGGKIENLRFTDAQVNNTGTTDTGIVAGLCRKGTTVTNCEVDNASTVTGSTPVGGIVGYAVSTSGPKLTRISNCRNYAAVSSTDTYPSNVYVGGIVGNIEYAVVERCSNYGAVSGTGNNAHHVGGIVGWLNNSVAMACLNNGTVYGTYSAGGIVGYQSAGSSNIFGSAYIVACGNEGSVSGLKNVGGIVGTLNDGAVYGSWTIDTGETSSGYVPQTEDGVGSGDPDSVDSAVGDASDVNNAAESTLNNSISDYNTRITNKNITYAGDASFWTCNYQWKAGSSTTNPTFQQIPSN